MTHVGIGGILACAPSFSHFLPSLVIYLTPRPLQVTMQNQLMPARHSNCIAYRRVFSPAISTQHTHFPGPHLIRIVVCTLRSNPILKPTRNGKYRKVEIYTYKYIYMRTLHKQFEIIKNSLVRKAHDTIIL